MMAHKRAVRLTAEQVAAAILATDNEDKNIIHCPMNLTIEVFTCV